MSERFPQEPQPTQARTQNRLRRPVPKQMLLNQRLIRPGRPRLHQPLIHRQNHHPPQSSTCSLNTSKPSRRPPPETANVTLSCSTNAPRSRSATYPANRCASASRSISSIHTKPCPTLSHGFAPCCPNPHTVTCIAGTAFSPNKACGSACRDILVSKEVIGEVFPEPSGAMDGGGERTGTYLQRVLERPLRLLPCSFTLQPIPAGAPARLAPITNSKHKRTMEQNPKSSIPASSTAAAASSASKKSTCASPTAPNASSNACAPHPSPASCAYRSWMTTPSS